MAGSRGTPVPPSHLAPHRIAAAYAVAVRAQPSVRLAQEVFERHVLRLCDAHPRFAASFERAALGDLLLAFACLEHLPEAQRVLSDVHVRAAAAHLARTFAGCDVTDIAQELTARLLGLGGAEPKLAIYTGQGSLAAFVRVAAVRLAQTTLRGRSRRREATLPDRLALTANPERLVLRKEFHARFTAAIGAALAELDADQRAVLRYVYYDSRPLEEIAALLGVSRATAGRRVVEAREQVLRAARKHVQKASGIGADEADSVLRSLGADLEVGLSTALGGAPPSRRG